MFRHARSAAGQDKIQPRRRQHFRRVHGLVYAADSNDRDRIEEANKELINVPNEDEMCDAAKQDMLNAVTAAEVIEKSGLHNLRKREQVISSACAEPAI